MPFGGVLFADKDNGTIAQWSNTSPVPFGGVLFADPAAQIIATFADTKNESPVPFGGVLFADPFATVSNHGTGGGVTSAFRRSAVRGLEDGKKSFTFKSSTSPVPFGGVLFADGEISQSVRDVSVESPVPFGGVLFADRLPTSLKPISPSHQCLSAECWSRTYLTRMKLSKSRGCHQCLSAECCSRTPAMHSPCRFWRALSPVLFGGVPFADMSTKLSQLIRNRLSPVPFGGVLFADNHETIRFRIRFLVTSAFRRSAVRGPVSKFRTLCCDVGSPVPFGGVLFADPLRKRTIRQWNGFGHQCLSAECCSRTRRWP